MHILFQVYLDTSTDFNHTQHNIKNNSNHHTLTSLKNICLKLLFPQILFIKLIIVFS